MKSALEQLSTYKSVHLNKKNVMTHFVGVPLIIWSVALLLATVSFELGHFFNTDSLIVNLATIVAGIVFIYYLLMSIPLAIAALVIFGPIIWSVNSVVGHVYDIQIAIITFAVGWTIQFLGHHYEKAKPAFVDDLNQLSIGPFFLCSEVYFLLGFNQKLEGEITKLAITKRRAFEQRKKAIE